MKLNAGKRLTAIADYKSAQQAYKWMGDAQALVDRAHTILNSVARVHTDEISKDAVRKVQNFVEYLDEARSELKSTYDL